MRKKTALERDLIAEVIRNVIDVEVKEHFDALMQEHQLTSRICGALEARFREVTFGEYRVRVMLQEMPEKRPGTLEKKTGVDLYIGIDVDEGSTVSKGIFVQAKWKEDGRSARDVKALVSQAQEIDRGTHAGYVWLYGPDGVDVVPAKEVAINPRNTP